MMKEFDMMILFVVEIVVVAVDDDLEEEYDPMMMSMMSTNHYWLLTEICIKILEICFLEPKEKYLLMDIDCLQLKSMRYRKDLLQVPLMNVVEGHWYNVRVYAI